MLIFLGLALSLSACIPSVYDRPYPLSEISLPRDDAAHRAPIEWWYYTANIEAEGRAYGLELTFFKAYTPPRYKLLRFLPAFWLIENAYVAHFAITDIAANKFIKGERADFWGYRAGSSAQDLNVFVADWTVERAADGISHRIRAAQDGYVIDLLLTPQKPAALHGQPPGIQSMGPAGTSYYLSYTRMSVSGTLKTNCKLFGCETQGVTGQAWNDHQWGDFDLADLAGWDWFSLQLDNNTELMLYLLREPSGRYSEMTGTYINSSGKTTILAATDFVLSPSGKTWQSPETGAIYPMGWRIELPRYGLDLLLEPVLLNQEMDTRASTGIVYWEGAITVSGSRSGVGYVELTNYDLYP